MDTSRSRRVLLEGWEKFDEPVDRIVSIGAFEHFGPERYARFFQMAYQSLPEDGVMLLHTIDRPTFKGGQGSRPCLDVRTGRLHRDSSWPRSSQAAGCPPVSTVEEHASAKPVSR